MSVQTRRYQQGPLLDDLWSGLETCVDCTAMVRASKALGLLTERKKSRHSHSLSSSSVDALKELQKIVALPDFDSMVKQYAQ